MPGRCPERAWRSHEGGAWRALEEGALPPPPSEEVEAGRRRPRGEWRLGEERAVRRGRMAGAVQRGCVRCMCRRGASASASHRTPDGAHVRPPSTPPPASVAARRAAAWGCTSAACACLMASMVCGLTPSSAATRMIATSVTLAPRARMELNASWPGVSRNVAICRRIQTRVPISEFTQMKPSVRFLTELRWVTQLRRG